jgi:hypothetical protein
LILQEEVMGIQLERSLPESVAHYINVISLIPFHQENACITFFRIEQARQGDIASDTQDRIGTKSPARI